MKKQLFIISFLLLGFCVNAQDVIQLSPQTITAISKQVPPGKDGLNGKDGAPGMQGAQGPQGPQGIQGPKGDPGIGSTKNGWVYHIYNASDIDSAISGLKAGKVGCFFFEATDINKDIVLPWQWGGNSKMLIINFNGVNLKGVIKTELPPTYSDAELVATQYKVVIRDGMLTGHGNDTTISLSCFINSEVSNIRSRSAGVAGYFAFNMTARIVGCDATGMKKAGYVLDRLLIPLATDSKRDLQSNNAFLGWDRVHNAIGCEYSFGKFGSNNAMTFMCPIEGNEPKTGVTYDDLGMSTVRVTHDLYNWCETKASVAMYKYKSNDGLINLTGWNSKQSPFLVDLTSASGALLNMDGMVNMLPSDRINMPVGSKINLINSKRVDTNNLFPQGKPSQYNIAQYYQNSYQQELGNNTFNGQSVLTFPKWNATATFKKDQCAIYGSSPDKMCIYKNLTGTNTASNPANDSVNWAILIAL